MKICHISRQDVSGRGGGYQAAYRIHESLQMIGCDSRMVVGNKISQDQDVFQAGAQNNSFRLRSGLTNTFHTNLSRIRQVFGLKTPFHPDVSFFSANDLLPHLQNTQIVHLHFISGFIASKQIKKIAEKSGVPIAWTLMDIEPITGGCHYSGNCTGYLGKCGRCPQLPMKRSFDLSSWSWSRKAQNFKELNMVIVAPTSWVKNKVRESSLFCNTRCVQIPLAINTDVFKPFPQEMAREKLKLPLNERLIFCGAPNFLEERKGLKYLIETMHKLKSKLNADSIFKDPISLVTAGTVDISKMSDLPFNTYHLGYLQGDFRLALAYQAADLLVSPTIEDAGPMMIPEAMMCSTPVVAFNTGGAPDIIETMKTGYLAELKNSSEMAEGVYKILNDANISTMRLNIHKIANQIYSPSAIATQYQNLYQELIMQ